jgi:hypothetical protein
MSDFKESMCTRALGVYDSFGNSLSVELSELVDKVDVGKDDWTIATSGH